jgi:hypothetical protein
MFGYDVAQTNPVLVAGDNEIDTSPAPLISPAKPL